MSATDSSLENLAFEFKRLLLDAPGPVCPYIWPTYGEYELAKLCLISCFRQHPAATEYRLVHVDACYSTTDTMDRPNKPRIVSVAGGETVICGEIEKILRAFIYFIKVGDFS